MDKIFMLNMIRIYIRFCYAWRSYYDDYDSENPNHPFEFTGDNAMTNNNMIAYPTKEEYGKTYEYYDS